MEWKDIYSIEGKLVASALCKKMPFIADQLRDCVFFLYDSEIGARGNEPCGGTGFFVSYPTPNFNHAYAVTNRHVIENLDGNQTAIRVNTVSGDVGTICLPKKAWLKHPKDADVMVAALDNLDPNLHFTLLETRDLLTREKLAEVIRVGEDVYMLGRFIKHSGKRTMQPTARSGMISLNPDSGSPINYSGAPCPQEAFLLEMRSLSGFSGSPVFHNLHAGEFINHLKIAMEVVYGVEVPPDTRYVDRPELFMTVLGIDAGSFYTQEDIEILSNGNPVNAVDYKSNVHSGFAIVIPGWAIMETLDRDEFAKAREAKEQKAREGQQKSGGVGDVAKRPPSLTSDSFLENLRRASRPLSELDQEKKET